MDDENKDPSAAGVFGKGGAFGSWTIFGGTSDFERKRAADKRAEQERKVREAAEAASATADFEAVWRAGQLVRELMRASGTYDPEHRRQRRSRLLYGARAFGGMLLFPRARWGAGWKQRARIQLAFGAGLAALFRLPTPPRIHVGPCADDCGGVAISLLWADDQGTGVQIDLHMAHRHPSAAEDAPEPRPVPPEGARVIDFPSGQYPTETVDAFMRALGIEPMIEVGPDEDSPDPDPKGI